MYQTYTLTDSTSLQVHLTDFIIISLPESSKGYRWEILFPSGIKCNETTTKPLETDASTLVKEWLISPTARGKHTLKFLYHKNCCGNPIFETKTFILDVL